MFVSPETENGLVGYSEPLRRFIQHEGFAPQVNEIANTMPPWIPGDDYMINFRKGDPYTKVDEGYARLPGAGYEALHPELEGFDPEDYPDITKLSILADIAPYSRQYNKYRNIVDKESRGNPELRARYEQILEQMRQTRESTLQVDERRFDAPVDQIEGYVKSFDWRLRCRRRFVSFTPGPRPVEQDITSAPARRLAPGCRLPLLSPGKLHPCLSLTLCPVHQHITLARPRNPTLGSQTSLPMRPLTSSSPPRFAVRRPVCPCGKALQALRKVAARIFT